MGTNKIDLEDYPLTEETTSVATQYQHCVPKLLLKRFAANDAKDEIFTYDLADRVSEQRNISRVGGNFNINEYNVSENLYLTAENKLAFIENRAAQAIDKIIKNDSQQLGTLNKTTLAFFMGIQYVRTEKWAHLHVSKTITTSSLYREQAANLAKPGIACIVPINKNLYNELRLQSLEEGRSLAKSFLKNHWILLKTTKEKPFLLGDNPVTPWNFELDRTNTSENSLCSPEISVLFPIGPERALLLVDETRLHTVLPAKNSDEAKRQYRILSPNQVDLFNYIQVVKSESHVFSTTNQFEIMNSEGLINHKVLRRIYADEQVIKEVFEASDKHLIKSNIYLVQGLNFFPGPFY